MRYTPFHMERWQSTWEHHVRFNLSESGVHPLTAAELLDLAQAEGAEAAVTGVRLGYGQSNGSAALRERIAALYPGASEANVLVTTGGAEANFVCAWQLIEPGDAAAVMLPTYGQIPGLLEGFGARVHPFHLREEDGWSPDLDALEAALAGGARVIVVTAPNNPTGRVLSPEEVGRIAEAADRHGAWILADEIYQGAEADGRPAPGFWGRSERVLVTNSLSKAYGLPGLRLGWVVGPPEGVQELWGRTDYTTISPASLSDTLARIALEPRTRARILERTRSIVRGNLGTVSDWLEGHADLFSWRPPEAGAIAWVRYRADIGSAELAERLRRDHDVLVVPGDHFGMDGFIRLGFGLPRQELTEALGRVGSAFAALG